MKKLVFDSGLQEFSLNGGVLRFNPADPNVYSRFLEAEEKLRAIEQQMQKKAAATDPADSAAVLQLLQQADRQMKGVLDWIFTGNDFEALLCGVNLLAVAKNGERVVSNLFAALEPVLVAGAKRCAADRLEAERKAR